MILLSVVFITCIPNRLNAGNKTGTIKNAFSAVVKLRFGREKIGFLFILYPAAPKTMNARLKEIKRGIVANGVSYPLLRDKLFINNPKNIRNEMLNPTDNTNCSVEPILSNFRTCRINNPGKIVRKRNPRICLKNVMSRRIAMSVRRSIEITNTNHFSAPNFNTILTP